MVIQSPLAYKARALSPGSGFVLARARLISRFDQPDITQPLLKAASTAFLLGLSGAAA
jgi:hypothetical protein